LYSAKAAQVFAVVRDVVVHHLLQRRRHEEVLLADTQHFALVGGVVRVQHAREVVDGLALQDRVGETLGIERVVVEFLHRGRIPQAQRTHVVGPVARDRHVVGDRPDVHVVEFHDALLRAAADDERVEALLPRIRVLLLEPVSDFLAEQAVAVEDAVARHRVILRDS